MAKKISIFIPSFENGGVERNVLTVSNILIENNYQVDLIFNKNSDELFTQLNNSVNTIKIKRFFNLPFIHPRVIDSFNILFGYFKYLFLNKNDLIVFSFQNSIIAIVLCKILHIPVIARVASHPNMVNIEKSFTVKLSQKLKNIVYRFANIVITNSISTSNEIKRLTKANVQTIYNPTFNSTIIKKSKVKIDDDVFKNIKGKKIITVGRLSYEKDFQTLIKAFSGVFKQLDCSLVFIGDGQEKENLINLSKKFGIEKKVYFLGFKENPYKYVANCELFVLTSLYEGLPNVLIEAIGVGTPVISTNCLSGPNEILLDGKGGDLVEVGNIEELSHTIIKNLTNVEYTKSKHKVAFQNLERFSYDNVQKDIVELVKRYE